MGRVGDVDVAYPPPPDLLLLLVRELPRLGVPQNPGLYRVFSGVVHGDTNTIKLLAYDEATDAAEGGVTIVPTVRCREMQEALTVVASAYQGVAWLMLWRMGANTVQMRRVFEESADALGLAESSDVRFWRREA